MKPYQLSGLSFLVYLHKNGLSGILGDEMGLGKTLQTLSLIQYLKETRKLSGSGAERRPCLVICPLSVLSSWMSEARRWTPRLKALRFHGPMVERNRVKRIASGEEDMYGNKTNHARRRKDEDRTSTGQPFINLESDTEENEEDGIDLIITTYDSFKSEESWFKRAFVWSYVVLDEGHKIKNDLSQVSKALQGLSAEYRLILTGTPLQNNLVELWALLKWLYPDVFVENTADLFKTSFNLSRGQVDIKVMDHARHLLELIMLRRMKNSPGVDLDLPPKTDVLLFVPLTPMQKFWYTRLLTRTDQVLLEELFHGAKGKEASAMRIEKEMLEVKDMIGLKEMQNIHGEAASAHWKESEEIVTNAIQQERQEEGKKSAWKKLMNLLMQLRKVRSFCGCSFARVVDKGSAATTLIYFLVQNPIRIISEITSYMHRRNLSCLTKSSMNLL
jgi:SWI/SNF-related matrix-associated actin-dependent regulator of chromatin subfamily A member 5